MTERKRCRDCREWFPATGEFFFGSYATVRSVRCPHCDASCHKECKGRKWPDVHVARRRAAQAKWYWRPYCKACDRVRGAQSRHARPEAVLAYSRAYRAGRIEEARRASREYQRRLRADPERLAIINEQRRARRGTSVKPLPDDPLVSSDVLRRVLDATGLSPVEVAVRMGHNNKRVYQMLEQPMVRLSSARAAVEAAGLDPVDVDL